MTNHPVLLGLIARLAKAVGLLYLALSIIILILANSLNQLYLVHKAAFSEEHNPSGAWIASHEPGSITLEEPASRKCKD